MPYTRIYRRLQEALGLQITSVSSQTLEGAVAMRLRALGLADESAYLDHLQAHPAEMAELIDEVVIPETWFFRDQRFFDALAALVLTRPLRDVVPLRILSIPCCTGEESYSIAITLMTTGRSPAGFQVDGVDVSRRAVERARRARYRERSFRATDTPFRRAYFHRRDDEYELVASIRKAVRFHHGNLIDPAFMAGLGRYHIVFCKNILIYLCEEARRRAMELLHQALLPGGYLFAGLAEIALFLDGGFSPATSDYAFVLGHRRAGSSRSQQPAASGTRPLPSAAHRVPAAAMAAPPPAPGAGGEVAPAPADKQAAAVLDRARRAADQGDLDTARTLLRRLSPQDRLHADAFYLLGLVAKADGDEAGARTLFKKAVYLDPHHREALNMLRLLAEAGGDPVAAADYRRRLAAALSQTPPVTGGDDSVGKGS